MRTAFALSGLICLMIATPPAAGACMDGSNRLSVSRIVTVDTSLGGIYGSLKRKDTKLLRDKEVILTFDDGPVPKRTRAILKALENHCAKATFFAVGTMSLAYPRTLRLVEKAGHTVASHTWRHARLPSIGFSRAKSEIEKGLAAVSAALGRPAAPFFRFPYLRDTRALLKYVTKRNLTTFDVDVVSGDTDGYGVKRMVRATMSRLRKRGRGILLFHDIKKVTTRALPHILTALHKEGYKVVHVVPKDPAKPDARLVAHYSKRLAKRGLAAAQKSTETGTKTAGVLVAAHKKDNPTKRDIGVKKAPIATSENSGNSTNEASAAMPTEKSN